MSCFNEVSLPDLAPVVLLKIENLKIILKWRNGRLQGLAAIPLLRRRVPGGGHRDTASDGRVKSVGGKGGGGLGRTLPRGR